MQYSRLLVLLALIRQSHCAPLHNDNQTFENEPGHSKSFIASLGHGFRDKWTESDYEPRCGIAPHALRIVNGESATAGSWPWAAALGKPQPDGTFNLDCSGTLIGARHVLSAAHCLVGLGKFTTHVIAGELDLNKHDDGADPIVIEIDEMIGHPGFSVVSAQHDIAVVRLKEPVDFRARPDISPICAPLNFKGKDLAGMTTTNIGWGRDNNKKLKNSPILKQAELNIISNEECNAAIDHDSFNPVKFPPLFPLSATLAAIRSIGDQQLCAGTQGVGSCNGDSGGPLMMQDDDGDWALIGVTSYGGVNGCAMQGMPGVYARVDQYLAWISQYM